MSLVAVSGFAEPPRPLTFDGVKRSEATRPLERSKDAARPLPPLSAQQQALVAGARARFSEIADAEKLPRACSSEVPPRDQVADESRFVEDVVIEPPGTLLVTLRLWSKITDWQGQGCCPRCERPCEPSTCGYCSPAQSCRQFAHERELEVRFRITPEGRVQSEKLFRAESKPVELERKPWVPPPPVDDPSAGMAVVPRVRGDVTATIEPGIEVERSKAEQFVGARRNALRACYERQLLRNPALTGRLGFTWVVTPQGRTASVTLTANTLGNDDVATCVKTVLRGWVWPFKPSTDSLFTCTFLFGPAL